MRSSGYSHALIAPAQNANIDIISEISRPIGKVEVPYSSSRTVAVSETRASGSTSSLAKGVGALPAFANEFTSAVASPD